MNASHIALTDTYPIMKRKTVVGDQTLAFDRRTDLVDRFPSSRSWSPPKLDRHTVSEVSGECAE